MSSNRIIPNLNKQSYEWTLFNNTVRHDCYFSYININKNLPYQGWKIHVSGNINNFYKLLDIVSLICLQNRLKFNYISRYGDVLKCFEKGMSLISTRKFMTIYPKNEEEFIQALKTLHHYTKNFSGSSIVTDRHFKDSNVLRYRYGVIKCSWINQLDKRPPLYDTQGNKYPDINGPFFSLPPFINDILISAENSNINNENRKSLLLNKRYEMIRIIHSSNAGNTYLAKDITNNEDVIIKEAKPDIHAQGISVIYLLRNEAKILKNSYSDFIPSYIDEFYCEDNFYLVQEYIIGHTLQSIEHEFNLLNKNIRNSALDKKEIILITQRIINALENIHQMGLVIEDVSPDNIIISEKRVAFIDFETSYYHGSNPSLLSSNKYFFTTNFVFDQDGFVADKQKLAYVFIHLLTQINGLIHYDVTGEFVVNTFFEIMNSENLCCPTIKKIIRMTGHTLAHNSQSINHKIKIYLESNTDIKEKHFHIFNNQHCQHTMLDEIKTFTFLIFKDLYQNSYFDFLPDTFPIANDFKMTNINTININRYSSWSTDKIISYLFLISINCNKNSHDLFCKIVTYLKKYRIKNIMKTSTSK